MFSGTEDSHEMRKAATTLTRRESTTIPIEADAISPDRFVGLDAAEIERLPLWYGRRRVPLGELFSVELGDPNDIHIEGDLDHVKRIGQNMSRGRITVHGDVGMHLGAGMTGGQIVVRGNVGPRAGAHMVDGLLWIHGDAGPMLGGAYAGEKLGMKGGVIIVDGDAGSRAAERMRRGIIVVQGNLGDFGGARMVAGSLFVFGTMGARPGAGMKRGTLVAFGGLRQGLLPTFTYSCTCESPAFLRYTLRRLRAWGLSVREELITGWYRRYTGDVTTIGKGEVLVPDQN